MSQGSFLGWRMKSALAACAATALASAADIALAPGQTLDWLADTPADGDVVKASGGTLAFTGDVVVDNVFELSGSVNADVASGATVRFQKKWLRKSADGMVTCTGPVVFGSTNNSAFAYLPPESLAFTPEALAGGAQVTFSGYPSLTVLPERWENPVPSVYGSGVYITLYGTDMFPVADGRITLPAASSGSITWRASGSEVFRAGVPVTVPEKTTLVLRRMTFDPEGGVGTSWTTSYPLKAPVAEFTTDVELAGGTLNVLSDCQLKHWGAVSGSGWIEVTDATVQRNFYGSLEGMTPASTLTLKSVNANWVRTGAHSLTRLSSSFPGHVVIKATSPTNITSIGFAPPDLKYETNAVYRLGSLKGEGAISGEYGPRLQYNKNQRVVIGRLEGQVNVFASSFADTCDLEIDEFAGGLVQIKNGLRLKVNGSSGYPQIHYSATQTATTNTVELADGVFVNEIRLPGAGKTVYLHGGTGSVVGNVRGVGTLVVEQGAVRIGLTEPEAKVLVRGGTATFGGGQDLAALTGDRLALWLDASNTKDMVGAWNAGWAASTSTGGGKKVLANCPAVTFNGAPAATYTNGFPLIEKWFDKRPSQRLNYGWQDRCVNYSSTLYTLVYPYLVPNGLNGRAYMSFGEHGEADLAPDAVGLSDTLNNANSKRERRRMPFMQDMKGTAPEGHAVYLASAVMVFGSQQGGGRGVLGGYQGTDEGSPLTSANGRSNWTKGGTNPACGCYFYRGGSDYAPTNSWLTSSEYNFYVDGVQVDATKTAPNGGWQVVAFDGNGRAVRSLGMSKNFTMAGGQNYAEILLFKEPLSTVERRTVEGYLAMKWNLPGALSVQGPVEVAKGATVRGHVMNVTGEGVWLIDSPEASPALDGSFAGALALNFSYADDAIADPKVLNSAATAATGVVTVDFAEKPKSGAYPLVAGTAVASFAGWSLRTAGNASGRLCSLEVRDGVLNLVVRSGGTMLLVR